MEKRTRGRSEGSRSSTSRHTSTSDFITKSDPSMLHQSKSPSSCQSRSPSPRQSGSPSLHPSLLRPTRSPNSLPCPTKASPLHHSPASVSHHSPVPKSHHLASPILYPVLSS